MHFLLVEFLPLQYSFFLTIIALFFLTDTFNFSLIRGEMMTHLTHPSTITGQHYIAP